MQFPSISAAPSCAWHSTVSRPLRSSILRMAITIAALALAGTTAGLRTTDSDGAQRKRAGGATACDALEFLTRRRRAYQHANLSNSECIN